MSFNARQTSEEIATLASKVLNDPNSSVKGKKLAGSALAQTHTDKQTGGDMETLASEVLRSEDSTEDEKSLAGSVLSQANKGVSSRNGN